MEIIVCITEGIPAQDEARVYSELKHDYPSVPPHRPELPGDHQPGEVQYRDNRGRDRAGRRPGRAS